ncbi:FAD-dependent oxidoreductase [Variovorax paradoxus]|jgi:glycine/D-amino acid oxidase-like deaminating enzyme|uniref:NAD(P)/FAD-dependent oxidoreductase n=1 Tax=Variovorax TaxID=34072 RepID=UPI0006E5242C|nr:MULTISPECIES: FAD-dependent oxidoreductase [unclassified Variovorax]KPU90180.1 FAD-dependent oxidoreductase [Variovorax paradoxus]KPV03166.1 FAD-dependent oxidoreductase [Variovorax paradoxus]KPV04393.1 FAD-dependent oxidoreductase [Variovorax paradoxus]KPV14727.1 FAD-dependent oxidoreductase [Variovorax paradoxus]KPV31858.1 FAD-dependent oxidoreductase [Variovorax paradoxus]
MTTGTATHFASAEPVPATPSRPYDPRYDPLLAPDPGAGRAYAPTWWVASAGTPPEDDGPLVQDIDVDVAIVGSGATGMSTALYLAQEHGIRATVLEANQAAWGCSSRSGGQGQNASGRLKRSQWIARWGLDTAKKLDAEIRAGFENFKALTQQIDCDAFDGGHLYLAHRREKLPVLAAEAALMRDTFGYATRMMSAEEVRSDYCDERETVGAMFEAEGVGIHPLKFTFGLLRRARALGVKVHTSSPVQGWQTIDGVHHLRTPGGTVRARRVAVCTGGYTGQALSPLLKNRVMPILSNSVVTRELTEAELKATNFRSKTFLTDTRTLRFYYRLLEGNRLQIGSRSSVSGADAEAPVHLKLLTDAIARKFPPLANIRIDHSWWGWVDMSHDMMPRITQPDASKKIWYAVGYGGNGVSFSTWAGKRLAERIAGRDAGREVFELPIYDSPLPFPNVMGLVESQAFAPFRRMGQRMLYKWYWLKDEK